MGDRRRFMSGVVGLIAVPLLPQLARAQTDDTFAPLIAAFTNGAAVTPGRVRLEMPVFADNANVVPLRVSVDSPMTSTHYVRRVTLLSEKNPRPVMATFHLGPHSGRAVIATRVRLNGAQHVMAIAHLSDNTYWSAQVEVIVTSSACWDES